jgi:translation elongation factor EF-Tu-like GTPase
MNVKLDMDAVVKLTLLPPEEGGRKSPISSGYRGQHIIKPYYQTSAITELIDIESLSPGESCLAKIKYITPEVYPNTLFVGREVALYEGARKAGIAVIKQIMNPVLLKPDHHVLRRS